MGEKRAFPADPRNAPGPFYVESGCCMSCHMPNMAAPDLMNPIDDYFNSCEQCWFVRQPETPEEQERAILAVRASCCRAVRYAGDDPAILKRLADFRGHGCCDALLDAKPERLSPSQLRGRMAARLDPLWDKQIDA